MEIPMRQLTLSNRNHKNGNGRRESDLARADNAARAAAEVTATRDTEENLEAEIAALEGDAKQENIDFKHRLSRLSARLADLKSRLASFEPSTNPEERVTR
jgi:hypothetical protein